MAMRVETNPLEAAYAALLENGLDGAGEALRILVNEAAKIERSAFLGARPYERTETRRDYANGFKPKTVLTRHGELTFQVPQVRSSDFYPSALEKGTRTDQAVNLALAEMYVQGVSTRRVIDVLQRLLGTNQQFLDLLVGEAGHGQVVTRLGQLGQFQREQFLVPPGIQCQTIVGDDIGPLLRRGEVAEFNDRHFQQIQLARCRQTTVAGNDAVGAVDEDGLCPAELDDAGGQLGDLRLGMRARIAGERDQRLDLAILDAQLFGHWNAKTRHRGGSSIGW